MSVLLVGDADAADDIQIQSSITQYDYLYRQLNELEHPFSVSPSIVRPNSCRPRHRPQQCAGQHLLTYMLALLVLTNHLHWSLIVLSVSSSISTVSTSTTTTTPGPRQPPSTAAIPPTDQQCLLINSSHIDRICSRTCRAPTTPFDRWLTVDQLLLDMHILPFCSNYLLNHSVNYTNFLNETSESQCREILTQLIAADDEARTASDLFATYMQAIDCASPENRYSIVEADCQRAYQTWTCSVKIPFFHRNHLIPPCQTICDEVERVCPTFRPSDREPLFAGQPLFFCSGGIVTNSDYAQRPHCFDRCHLADGSLQRHSVSPSPSSASTPVVAQFIEDIVTTPPCFEIEPLASSPPVAYTTPTLPDVDDSFNRTSNASMPSSVAAVRSSTTVTILTILVVLVRQLTSKA